MASHHSFEPTLPDEVFEHFGKQNTFPEGKLTEDDEGAIQFGVSNANGKVIVNFGSPVAWLGMNPQQARILASYLNEHADAALIVGGNRHERRANARAKRKESV